MDILSFHFWFANRELFHKTPENMDISQESWGVLLLKRMNDD